MKSIAGLETSISRWRKRFSKIDRLAPNSTSSIFELCRWFVIWYKNWHLCLKFHKINTNWQNFIDNNQYLLRLGMKNSLIYTFSLFCTLPMFFIIGDNTTFWRFKIQILKRGSMVLVKDHHKNKDRIMRDVGFIENFLYHHEIESYLDIITTCSLGKYNREFSS